MAVFERDYMRSRGATLHLPQAWTLRLIVLCAVVWFVQMACRHWFRTPVESWFGLSLHGVQGLRLWTPVTYALLHAGFGHLLWNCVGIWIFGGMLERALRGGDFVRMTLWAAPAGAAGYLVGDVVMGGGGYVIGASGIVSAYLALAALSFPRAPLGLLLLPSLHIPLWSVAVVFFAVDVLGAFSSGSTGIAYWAHLGGAAYGAVVFRCGVVPRWRVPRIRFGAGRAAGRTPPSPPTRRATHDDGERERVDALLAKISRGGIAALTDAEREFLNEASRRYR